MYILGIDLGTTGCKSMVFKQDGTILGSDYIEYDLIITEEGFIEQDANIWWNNVKTSISNSVKCSGIDPSKVIALSISSQGISFVPIDKDGNTLMNAISWLDGRAVDETNRISLDYDSKFIFNDFGKLVLPFYLLPKLMWLKNHKPDIYDNTWKFLMGMDYLIYKLTGKAVTDYSMASGTLAYSLKDKVWYEEIFKKYEIDMDKMPELGCLGEAVGSVTQTAAKELGFTSKTLVVMGAQDQRCASFGAGIEDGIVTVSLGTATAVCSICSHPIIDAAMKVTCCGLDRDHWMLESVIGTSGVALKWVKNKFFKDISYKEMDQMAASAPVGAGGVKFYPHFEDKGAGSQGSFIGIGLHTTEGDIIRSVLEGIAFQIKLHIESHERLNGTMREIRLFGGGANSGPWAQIIADVTGRKVIIPRTSETANLGAAMLASVGAGLYENVNEATTMVGNEKTEFVADHEKNIKYNEIYKKYCEINDFLLRT